MNSRVFHASQAHKLDAPDRRIRLPPERVLELLPLRRGQSVADVGAGTGYFAIPISQAIGHEGVVFAVDLQPEMLALLSAAAARALAVNIRLVPGTAENTTLESASCDLVLLANVFHEVDDREAVLQECKRILRPDGKLAILEWRTDVSPEPGPPIGHRIAGAELRRTLENNQWAGVAESLVGEFSYLATASPGP